VRLVFVVLGVTACEPSAGIEQDYLEFPTRIVTPPCSDAQPPVALEFRAVRDLQVE